MYKILLVVADGKKQAMQNTITFYFSLICYISCEHSSIPYRKDYVHYYSVYKCKYCGITLGPIFVKKEYAKQLEEKNITEQIQCIYDD